MPPDSKDDSTGATYVARVYSSIRLLELIISDSCFLPTVIYYLETPPILTNIYIIFTFILVLAVEIDKEK